MRKLIIVLTGILACGLPAAPASAQFIPQATAIPGSAPEGINYQGRLEDGGFPVNATKSMVFRVHSALTGGTLLWTSPAQNVSVALGLFSVVVPVPTTVLVGGGARYLEVQIDGTLMSPRELLNSVPYALIAKSVEGTIDVSTAGLAVMANSAAVTPALFISSQTGNVGVGTAAPAGLFTVGNATLTVLNSGGVAIGTDYDGTWPVKIQAQDETTTRASMGFRTYNSWAPASSYVNLRRARGSAVSPAAVLNGDDIAVLSADGHTGSSWGGTGVLAFTADGNFTAASSPGRFVLATTPAGSTGPVERLRVDSSGNVGVGTSSPANRLDVAGGGMILRSSMTLTGAAAPAASAAGQGALYFDSAQNKFLVSENGGAYQPLGNAGTYVSRTGDAMTGPLTMLSGSTVTVTGNAFSVGGSTLVVTGGSVGIGTASPDKTLNVFGTANNFVAEVWNQGAVTSSNGLYVHSTNADPATMVLAAGNLSVMGDGKVGIGTTAPRQALHVAGAMTLSAPGSGIGALHNAVQTGYTEVIGSTSSDTGAGIYLAGNTFAGVPTLGPGDLSFVVSRPGSRFEFQNSSSNDVVVIQDNGRVGIGTTSPGAALDVAGHQLFSVAGASITFNAGGPTIGVPMGNTLAFGTSGIERMRLDNLGNIGIGTGGSTPADRLEVAGGNVRLTAVAGTAGSVKLFSALTVGAVTCTAQCGANTFCLAAWDSAGTASTCGTAAADNRCLCSGFGN